ncbi:hypothetical protein ROZALSC1DRAFT_20220 [Rozella allomycis CSF55]|uniref:Uncharacterized protein n=1 Tax=Rozella allomycis (strain CSF55) TaxID=988480 RepID=A0A4P9YSP9_ROZAC|nr:hypothetical protein ROZALSC1DRAFT_20220 [Rozella allomycis CSF55]
MEVESEKFGCGEGTVDDQINEEFLKSTIDYERQKENTMVWYGKKIEYERYTKEEKNSSFQAIFEKTQRREREELFGAVEEEKMAVEQEENSEKEQVEIILEKNVKNIAPPEITEETKKTNEFLFQFFRQKGNEALTEREQEFLVSLIKGDCKEH